jgi:transcriptional regulator with XRE-family HTH domain
MVFTEDVGAKFFASYNPACPLLHDDGALRRKSAAPLSNLTQKLRVKSKRFGNTREAAMFENISSDVHDRKYIARCYSIVNSMPLVDTGIAQGYIVGMKDIETIRKENAVLLLGKGGLIRQAELARRMHISPAQVQQWKAGYRTPESESCRKIEKAAELPVGWMDQDHTGIDAEHRVLAGSEQKGPDVVALSSPEATSGLIPQTRALVEQIITKSKENKLSEGDIALLISTVTRLSGDI